jgi:hypothetical protein
MRRIILPVLAVALVAAACAQTEGIESATTDETIVAAGSEAATGDGTVAVGTDIESTDGDACPDEVFLVEEVNSYEQSGGAPDPELEVACTDDTLVVASNNIPNFEFVQMTPNDLEAQDNVYEIPLEPTEADTPGAMGLGTVGVTVTGLDVFGAFEAPQDGYRDPYLDGLLDFCNGHTAPGGQYHVHARYDCIFDDPDQVGLVYGYLFDGYELVSPWICVDDACTETRQVTSSYVRIDDNGIGAFEAWEYQEGAGDLDICNGMVGADGEYRYYLTDEFPYLPFCFHGVTDHAQGDFTGDAPAGGAPAGADIGAAGAGTPGVPPPGRGRP